MEYIESTGKQYIDTKYAWKNENIKIVCSAMLTSSTGGQSLFGNEEYVTGNSGERNFGGIPFGGKGEFSIYCGNKNMGKVDIASNDRFDLELSTTKDKNLIVKFNGLEKINVNYLGSVVTKHNSRDMYRGNIYIFANHNSLNNTTEKPTQNIGGMRLYSFKMYDDNLLVRDMVPVKRNSDDAVGLYDIVNCEFYLSPVGTFDYRLV